MKINQLQILINLIKDQINFGLSLLSIGVFMNLPLPLWRKLYQPVITRFFRIRKTRGLADAVREMKVSRLAFTRWLCNRPLVGNVGVPIAKDGLPKILPREIRQLLKNRDVSLIKAVMTVLNVSRYIKGGGKLDLGPITESAKILSMPNSAEIILALKAMGVPIKNNLVRDHSFSWITTAGPSGPSLTTSLSDLPLFMSEFKEQVKVLCPSLLPVAAKLLRWEDSINLSSILKLVGKKKSDHLRKLSIKPDREMKMRPFAIFDYWSQTTLTPLHDWLYKTLRSIPEDCTFDQVKGVRMIRDTTDQKWFYSFDLKSATDRFPVKFQEKVLALLTNTEYASAWTFIMTHVPFKLEGHPTTIKFAAGQPLGAKSSWAMFALCHHIVVRIAAARVNAPAIYVILGDDIVIKGSRLAQEYKRIMCKLGVEISDTKTHVSKDTFEFAKIWTSRGINVSGFPLVGFIEALNRPIDMAVLMFFELPKKGYEQNFDPRTLSLALSHLTWTSLHKRKGIYFAHQVCLNVAFLAWLSNHQDSWAKYIVQKVEIATLRSSNCLLTLVVRDLWITRAKKGLWDLRALGTRMMLNIPSSLSFVDEDQDDLMFVGKSEPGTLQLDEKLLNIPILGALNKESKTNYDCLLSGSKVGLDPLTWAEIEGLTLPPTPQLKGFKPLRNKPNRRALTLLHRGIYGEVAKRLHFVPHVQEQWIGFPLVRE